MKLTRALLLISVATGLFAQTSTWDTSGNGMLNGQYYFRHVLYVLSSTGDGTLYDELAVYGTVTFNGTGAYTMNATLVDVQAQQLQSGTLSGTYSIAASGQGFLTNPVSTGDFINGTVNAQGIFVGSSTENPNGYNDMFVAAPLSNPLPAASTFKGSYSLSYMDLSSGNPLYTLGGHGLDESRWRGQPGHRGSCRIRRDRAGPPRCVQSLSNVKYIFSGGAAVVTFPNSNTAAFTGQYYFYFSPDGNFVFGGSPFAADLFVGVRTGTGTPNLNGLYYEAGLDQDESTLSAGYASLDSFYGSLSAGGGNIVGHQRLLDFFNPAPANYTYSDTYSVPSNGAYSNPSMNYVVGGGIRIGSGIGPYLGLSVALQAPTMSSSLSSTGVFLNPQGVVNAGSSAPFTAGIAPGELLTLYGSNLAAGLQVASAAPFLTSLGGVQVMINGIPAPIYYVTPTQLSAIVPYGISGTVAKVQVFNNNVQSNAVTVADQHDGARCAHPIAERAGVRRRDPPGWHAGQRQESGANRRNGIRVRDGVGRGEPHHPGWRRRAHQPSVQRHRHDRGLYRRRAGHRDLCRPGAAARWALPDQPDGTVRRDGGRQQSRYRRPRRLFLRVPDCDRRRRGQHRGVGGNETPQRAACPVAARG